MSEEYDKILTPELAAKMVADLREITNHDGTLRYKAVDYIEENKEIVVELPSGTQIRICYMDEKYSPLRKREK